MKSSAKKKGVSFVIDCSKPVDDKIMEIPTLEKFLQERIKVGGKPGALGDAVSITTAKGKITVTADSTFSKRYITSYKLAELLIIDSLVEMYQKTVSFITTINPNLHSKHSSLYLNIEALCQICFRSF